MAGTYGFELDLTTLNEEEIAFLAEETAFYKKYSGLVRTGDYYRLTDDKARYMAWQFVSKDKKSSLAVLVQKTNHIDYKPIIRRFEGLCPDTRYRVIIDGQEREEVYSGTALMQIGIRVGTIKYECESTRVELIAE